MTSLMARIRSTRPHAPQHREQIGAGDVGAHDACRLRPFENLL
ncbi:MAG TPA: hypothetical protein VGL05_32000 [Kribbella sp.]